MENKKSLRCILPALALALFSLNAASCNGQQKMPNTHNLNVSIGKHYDSSVSMSLYEFRRQNHCDQSKAVSIIKDGKISPCFSFVRFISKQDTREVIRLLNDSKTYGNGEPCFDTDYALLIIDNNTVVGYINISFRCHTLMAVPSIAAQEQYIKDGWTRGGVSSMGNNKLLSVLKLSE
jgi:hypothetical protein